MMLTHCPEITKKKILKQSYRRSQMSECIKGLLNLCVRSHISFRCKVCEEKVLAFITRYVMV